ncbi:MAG: outer membrane beta-barrel protein [Geminicoccaceae bacterium]
MTSRNIWLASVAAGAIAMTGPAAAQGFSAPQSLYGGVSVGTATFFDNNNLEYDYFGFVIAGQVGIRLSPDIRVEGELAYESTTAEIDDTNIDVDVTAFRPSVSAYYEFNTITLGGMTPYAGGGLGISFLEADVDGGGSDDDEELSAHVEGGATLKLNNSLDIVPAARWELTDDASNFQFRVGTRFWF